MAPPRHKLVYGLVDPRTLLVRYVGQSSSGLARPRSHGTPVALLKDSTHKARWIKALRAAGLDYTIVVLEDKPDSLSDAERFWIAFGRACGWPLTNLTDGGEGTSGYKAPAEVREKIAASKRGKPRSPETRAKLSASKRGRPLSAEHRAKLARASSNPSAETRAKLSAWERTPEYRSKLAASNRGRRLAPPASAETRAKMSAAWTPERKARQAAHLSAWRNRKCVT